MKTITFRPLSAQILTTSTYDEENDLKWYHHQSSDMLKSPPKFSQNLIFANISLSSSLFRSILYYSQQIHSLSLLENNALSQSSYNYHLTHFSKKGCWISFDFTERNITNFTTKLFSTKIFSCKFISLTLFCGQRGSDGNNLSDALMILYIDKILWLRNCFCRRVTKYHVAFSIWWSVNISLFVSYNMH